MNQRSRWSAIVRDLMTEHACSERLLSKRTRISRSVLRNFLHDDGGLRIDHLERILHEFGCDLEAMPIEGFEPPKPATPSPAAPKTPIRRFVSFARRTK
mgnify:CR=1 FL=1